jgi:hypothetical protein
MFRPPLSARGSFRPAEFCRRAGPSTDRRVISGSSSGRESTTASALHAAEGHQRPNGSGGPPAHAEGRESLWPRSHLSSHFRVMLPRAGSARLGEWMSAERSPGAETLSMGIAARSLRSTGSTSRCSGEAFGLLGPNGRGGRDVGLLTPRILPTRGSAPVARSSGGCWRRTKVEAVGRNRRGALIRRAGGRDGSGLIRTGFGRRPRLVGASRQPLPVAPGDVPVITGRSATPAHIGARRHVSETLRAQSRDAVGGILSPAGRRPSRMRIP